MKIIKILLVIIIVCGILLSFKILFKTSTHSQYTRNDIINLLYKIKECTNYSFEYKDKEQNKITYKFKNNVVISEFYGLCAYSDYNTNETFLLNKNEKRAIVSNMDSEYNTYVSPIFETINDFTYQYTYLKEENYNNHNCIVFQLDKDNNYLKIWIDSDSGFVLKTEEKGDTSTETIEYYINFNSVTDDDIKKLDLTEYEIKEK